MANTVKRIARRSKTAIVIAKIYENCRARRRFSRGDNESVLGSTHRRLSLTASLDYINRQFNDYLSYGSLTAGDLADKSVVEIGFGDNVGVALRFLAAGAGRVACVDKFYSRINLQQQRKIYEALGVSLPDDQRKKFDRAIDLTNGVRFNPERLICIYGIGADALDAALGGSRFDLIVSRAVLQDIPEPSFAFDAMSRVLKPGGLMMHKIDLSDQGIFRDNGMHPLTFLTLPEMLYRLMSSDSGNSNRKLAGYYVKQMRRLGYDARCFITSLIGHGGKGDLLQHCQAVDFRSAASRKALALLEQVRPRLAAGFRELPDDELIVDGIFLVARKPPQQEPAGTQWRRPSMEAAGIGCGKATNGAVDRTRGILECV